MIEYDLLILEVHDVTALKIILGVVYLIICVVLVILVLLQDGKQQGIGAITGGTDTFFGKGKTKTKEGMLNRLTVVLSVFFAVIAIVFGAIMKANF